MSQHAIEVSTASRRAAFAAGAKDELPILLGVVPFGLIYGAVAVGAGMPPAAALAASSLIFAGSAQFVTAQLFGAGTPSALIVASGFLINLRHLLYSASLIPYLGHLRPPAKGLLAYLMTDEAYAVAITRFRRDPAWAGTSLGAWYYAGAGLALWVTWQATTLAGVLFGARVPESWGLDFALPLTFIALLIPTIRRRSEAAAALSAGAVASLGAGAPLGLGLFLGALTGMVAGLLMSLRDPRSPEPGVRRSQRRGLQ